MSPPDPTRPAPRTGGALPLAVASVAACLAALLAAAPGLASGSPSASQEPSTRSAELDRREAQAALERGDAEAAERLFRRLLIFGPDDVDLQLGWARAVSGQSRSAEAASGLLRAGERALRRGDGAAAALLLDEAIQLAPQRAEAWARYGEALLLEQRHVEAESALREAVRLDPASPGLRLQLAAACWENGRLEEADEHYRAAVDRAREWPVGWFQWGRFLVWQGRFSDALEPLEKALELGLDGVDVRLERARALDGARAGSGDLELARRAVAAWRTVVERAPDEAFGHYGLALALRAAGDVDGSRRELEIYRTLYQRDQERTRQTGIQRARVERARAEIAAGRPGSALEQLAELAETVEVLEVRARAELILGNAGRAQHLLARALALDPARADLRRRLDHLRASGPPG